MMFLKFLREMWYFGLYFLTLMLTLGLVGVLALNIVFVVITLNFWLLFWLLLTLPAVVAGFVMFNRVTSWSIVKVHG